MHEVIYTYVYMYMYLYIYVYIYVLDVCDFHIYWTNTHNVLEKKIYHITLREKTNHFVKQSIDFIELTHTHLFAVRSLHFLL